MFNTTRLAGNRVLVEGTDVRGNTDSEVLDSTQWDSQTRKGTIAEAQAEVDAAIEALIAPVTAAIESAKAKLTTPELDPLFYVVEREEVEHQPGRPRLLTKLNRDSVVLRAIEEGQSDRLVWVNHQLEVTAAPLAAVDSAEHIVPADQGAGDQQS